MGLLDILGLSVAIGLIMVWVDPKAFKEKRRQWPLIGKIWHHIKVANLAFVGVYVLGVITSSFLIESIFKNQNPYIFSGSPVTVISFLFWGAIGIWIAAGREAFDDDADLDLSTSVGRLNWFVERSAHNVMRLARFILKWSIWIVAVGVGFVLIFLFSKQVSQRLEAMSSAQAIVLAGIIIAIAILAVGKRR